ncbi:hypothetical protein SeI_A1194 [Salmonella enterica subsp. enterica serovar 4 [Salmonella enterica subsp. enterica serovar 4 [Salmonella enterica subsp. enterica serovar 4,[5],12:i:- str. CVM23701]|nr:hypothetical protein STU288_1p00215 [Salmonella enterica subsp. enterica serovar Typhimurium str. U288]AIE08614.1 hypothetical protein DC51_p0028 [Salmonella enterica subsp. enterica serovar Typhimurium]ARE54773.1 fimbrial protein [Salmonella enterica]EDZ14221.1 hypothetical protein SeI_A1194 [Salmonella enterica subsp. enterica serovar 4 [Salmonella enterica subsp. enterica serovar 4 [Salmonella enterica subsp. enterica serovar 4,[5],12:i:- str. CVM23701]ESE63814.1 hypothetical protein SETA
MQDGGMNIQVLSRPAISDIKITNKVIKCGARRCAASFK